MLTALHQDLRVGKGPRHQLLPLGPSWAFDQWGPLWSGQGPRPGKGQGGAGALPQSPPVGPSPGEVQMAAANTKSVSHTMPRTGLRKHFLEMLGQPAAGRAAPLNFQGDSGMNFCIDRSWSLVRGGERSQPSTLVDDDREVGVGSRDLGQRAPHLCLWTTVLHPICSTATSYMQPSRVPLGSTTLPSGCSVPLPPVSRSSHRVCLSSCLTWTVLSHPHNIPEGGGAAST